MKKKQQDLLCQDGFSVTVSHLAANSAVLKVRNVLVSRLMSVFVREATTCATSPVFPSEAKVEAFFVAAV